eukprot:TRINITY_DN35711_c0_g1_i1.p1 TRINITY_DN35711_c0_g1~~TRINITY_DN35711_c0_g1_i1.p1  ORF type:complete len:914 (-),score=89.55 TRINITY_DN35711_c0_g1_i1:950-3463(-)
MSVAFCGQSSLYSPSCNITDPSITSGLQSPCCPNVCFTSMNAVLPGSRSSVHFGECSVFKSPALRHATQCPPQTDRPRAVPQCVLSEPPEHVRDYSTVRRMVERDFGNGLGVLYDTPQRGSASPFGATARDNGVNFAVQSSSATTISLCLFTEDDLQKGVVSTEVPLHPILNRTGNVWHIFLPGLSKKLLYGYRVDGKYLPEEGLRFDASKVVLDPYAKVVVGRREYGVPGYEGDCWPQMAGMVPAPEDEDEFDWEGDSPPKIPQKDLVIYEMHVRGFTRHRSSGVQHPGTYLGLVEKLPHLKALGINAIELMPVHDFNELEYYSYNPGTGDHKVNFWGYSTINFFSPMTRYAAAGISDCGRGALREFKTLVKEAHRLGMEVIMDVVFNHTAEGNEMGPTLSFRGLDNRVYYMIAPMGEFYNYSGCGNTLNCNHPVVRRFIVDCLRYWVLEMHIDGFRFDLAAILTRASSLWDKQAVFGSPFVLEGDTVTTGTPLSEPPLVDMISNDPVLRSVKLIAEAWDAGGLYQVGNFPHWGVWSEWNGQFRDTVRQFIKGTDSLVGAFAQMLCGSPNIYQEGGRKPWHSINFVTAHDGFSLVDAVSYNEKHNLPNGENNNDGENHNCTWNCGEEGELVSRGVQRLRQRQMRNFMLALMLSQGVPMVTMGDEYGHTKGGNNNTYCHDSDLNYFRWDKASADPHGFNRFYSLLVNFRRKTECLGLDDFPTAERLTWHGLNPEAPDWSASSRFIAFTIRDADLGEMYVAFNASHVPALAVLPDRPGHRWRPLVDTAKPAPYDFLADDLPDKATAELQFAGLLAGNAYPLLDYSSVILIQGPDTDQG